MSRFTKVYKILMIISIAFVLMFTTTVFAAGPAQVTVEGQSNYYVTGESYASAISFSGYNASGDKMYLNFTFETTKTVAAGQTATFNYYVEIFDDAGNKIGSIGSLSTPETATGSAGVTSTDIKNKIATMTQPLTAQFKTVVSVVSTSIS